MLRKLNKMLKNFFKNKILFFAVFASVIVIGGNLLAGEPPKRYWVCDQMGLVEREYAYAVSNIFKAKPNHHDDKESKFQEEILNQHNNFNPDYEPRCWEFHNQDDALNHKNRALRKAKERSFRILDVYLRDLEK